MADDAKKMKFEEALQRLEKLVAGMETGQPDLERLMKDFEEGRALVAFCRKELETISQRIEKVVGGGAATEPLEFA